MLTISVKQKLKLIQLNISNAILVSEGSKYFISKKIQIINNIDIIRV